MWNEDKGDYPPEVLARPVLERAVAWLRRGETGLSSLTIWDCLAPQECQLNPFDDMYRQSLGPTAPWDIHDWRRCWLLLRLIPEWRPRLHEVAERHPKWQALVEHWDELEALYLEERNQTDFPQFRTRLRELLWQKEWEGWEAY